MMPAVREVFTALPKRHDKKARDGIHTKILSAASAKFRWLVSKRGLTASSAYGARAWGIDLGTKILGLRPGYEYVVGRDDEADIVIPASWPGADTVSRLHASLVPQPNGLLVRDLDSSNGTRVGMLLVDERAQGITLIRPAELQVGDVALSLSPLGLADSA